MYSIFVLDKDSNGLEFIRRAGKQLESEKAAQDKLAECKKGFIIDSGNEDMKGVSHYTSYLMRGHRVIAAKGMPRVQDALTLTTQLCKTVKQEKRA